MEKVLTTPFERTGARAMSGRLKQMDDEASNEPPQLIYTPAQACLPKHEAEATS
jgi:hypothetical protein